VTESAYQAQIVDFADRRRWAAMHVYRSHIDPTQVITTTGLDGKGWPDLVLFRPPRRLAIEVKRELGRVTEEQAAWLDLLAACGFETLVAWPSNWDDVVALLT
jgi:hypothetical protein